MRCTRWLQSVILFSLILPLAAFALHTGQSPESVRAEMGEPNGVRQLADGEIWVYSGDIALTFKDGQLIRARGKALAAEAAEGPAGNLPENPVEEEPEPEEASKLVEEPEESGEAVQVRGASVNQDADSGTGSGLDGEIGTLSREMPVQADFAGEEGDGAVAAKGPVTRLLEWLVSGVVLFVFLCIAFRWVGAEADKGVLFLIAMAGRLVAFGVQGIFFDLLAFPTAFHADTLASFMVVLVLVTKLTHARSLPTAIKVVVAAKVAALIAFYLLEMFFLFNL